MNKLDSKILHKILHLQGSIMYALFQMTVKPEVREHLEKRMTEVHALMKEINAELEREHDALVREATEKYQPDKDTPKN